MRFKQIIKMPGRLERFAAQIWRDVRPAGRKHNISMFRIIREQVALRLRNKLRPDEYFLFGLDDPSVPWEEKLAYIGGALHREHWYVMTPPQYHYFFKNKLAFKYLFGSAAGAITK